jgi:methylated-DNA-[protein]-cysteine S-methyltransferase
MTEPELDALARELTESAPLPPGAAPDITAAAARAGLLDVAYATLESPLGRLLVAATDDGLVRLAYLDGMSGSEDAVLQELAARVSPRVLASPRRLDQPRRELDEYFAGTRREFELPLDWRLVHGFGRRVLDVARAIPYGACLTYKEVAAAAGSPRGSRAAGNALGRNPLPIIVPCHRVLHSTGGLGGYTGGLERKRALLAIEAGAETIPGL